MRTWRFIPSIHTSFIPSTHSYYTSVSMAPGPGVYNEAQAQNYLRNVCTCITFFPSVFSGSKSFPFESYFNLPLNYFKETQFIWHEMSDSGRAKWIIPFWCELLTVRLIFSCELGMRNPETDGSLAAWVKQCVSPPGAAQWRKKCMDLELDDPSSNVAPPLLSFVTWGNS